MRPKVLTVDDEPEFLEIEKLYLAKHRMDVTPCRSADEAVDELKSGSYDVVVAAGGAPGESPTSCPV